MALDMPASRRRSRGGHQQRTRVYRAVTAGMGQSTTVDALRHFLKGPYI